jgi:ABC-type transport system involved in multi-copper enzyme maturation permease subunit
MTDGPPTSWSTVQTLAGVTLRRLSRGKALWIGALIAALPLVYAFIMRGRGAASPDDLFTFLRPLLALLPGMFIGASIGEEIEERTSTYLWSRAIERWVVLAGKLVALAPIVIGLVVAAWVVSTAILTGSPPTAISCVALGAGALAASLTAAGISTVVPKHGMALTTGYMLVDNFIGVLPVSLREVSITYQAGELAHLEGGPMVIITPVIALAVIAADPREADHSDQISSVAATS